MPDRHGASVYDDLPDGVVVTDSDGCVVVANQAALRILGLTRADLVAQPLAVALPLIDPQGRDWWECTRPFDGLSTRVRQPEQLLTLTRPGRPDQPLLVTASFVRDDERNVTSLVACFRDTAARARQERSGAELVSVVAHELRSPLTSVKGFTATMLTKWERFNDEQKLHMLRTVNADADRLTRLISELLDVSRIEIGRLELRKQVVDVIGIVERDVAARVAAGESPDRFVVVAGQVLPEIWADPDKIAQVVGNVIENALRHGAGTVTVTVRPGEDGGASVEVVDEGEGITAQAMPRIFTKFWRDATRGGTGLGLFIAKGIVDAHGGTIVAGQAPGGGAAVSFSVPAGTPSFAD